MRLNGEVLTTPAVKIQPGDILLVDGKPIAGPEPARVWRYHKPVGLLTSHNDPMGRPTVFGNLPPGLPRVISIGRLDLNSEGLLLLTNDGGLARALELPSTGLTRRYRARARGRITQERLDGLKDGLTVEGVRYGGIEATLDKVKEGATSANLWITITLAEGKNREVRKVLEAVGLTVNRLIRLAYGPFQLGALAAGEAEEVGPRVIREQLAEYIVPENLPTSNQSLPTVGSLPVRKPRAFHDPTAEKAKTVYKTGWARPTFKPDPHKLGPKRFKPKAEPTVISARALPKRDGGSVMDQPRRDDRKSDDRKGGVGKAGGKPFKGKPKAPGGGDKKWFDGPKARSNDAPKPRGETSPAQPAQPAKPGGMSGQPYAGSNPRNPAPAGAKTGGGARPGGGAKPGGGARPGGKPYAGKGPPRGRR